MSGETTDIEALKAAATRELAGEPMLWAGQPDAGHTLRHGFKNGYWGSIFMTGFMVFWLGMASGLFMQTKTPSPDWFRVAFTLFGVPFLCIGLWGLLAPMRTARQARRTLYVVTDKRLAVFERTRTGTNVRSIHPSSILSMERVDHTDDLSTLKLVLSSLVDHGENGQSHAVTTLIGIADGKRAQDLLLSARSGRA